MSVVALTSAKAVAHTDRRESNFDNDYGIMTELGKLMKNLINSRVRSNCHYKGGDVVQHGEEVNNWIVPNFDFPITVFTPANRIISCLTQEGLMQLFCEINNLNYACYLNRKWVLESDSQDTKAKKKKLYDKLQMCAIEFDKKSESNGLQITILTEEAKALDEI